MEVASYIIFSAIGVLATFVIVVIALRFADNTAPETLDEKLKRYGLDSTNSYFKTVYAKPAKTKRYISNRRY